jgi:NAD(P)-dependent dehydrogenase (short-subunit alcohol dehydrogenase family)
VSVSVSPRTVLITGGSSGFGRAIAEALAARGDRVYGTTRRSGLPETGSAQVRMLTMDVGEPASVDAAVARVITEPGRIDALINNAGFGIAGAIEDTSDAEARAQFETNFFGLHRVCRAVLPQMRRQGGGRVINVSSLAGLVAVPYQALYCASKHAIEAYTEALRMEMKPFGIHVSMIEPGDFATSFTDNRRMVEGCADGSAHHARCRTAVARMQEDERKFKDLTPVVKTVLAALDDPQPALRYPVAVPIQRFLVGLKPFVPQRLFEYLIMDNYKLTR